ncbi:MAG: DUF1801 domain-containing protein [Chloroflexi bacterium]|nr:DUF1801 domain-containing protein [Chloroflexota bacterium]
MAEPKTKKNKASVSDFISSVENKTRRADAEILLGMMTDITSEPASMWGPSLIGFGSYDYTYASGHSGTWFAVGFSPRKQNLVVYIMSGFDKYERTLTKLGKYRTGKCCLYINKLADIDTDVLKDQISKSYTAMLPAG